MDFSKISKAIAGGISGAATAVIGTGAIQITLPAASPSWEHYVGLAILGFVVGFGGVYFAPANKPA